MDWLEPTLGYRILGAFGGAIVALAIIEPGSWLGFVRRFVVSMICGVFFADVIGEYLGWTMLAPQRIIPASCLASVIGWWAIGAVIKGSVAIVTKWFSAKEG